MNAFNIKIDERAHDLDRHHLDGHSLAVHERMLLRAQTRESRRRRGVPFLVPLAIISFVVGFCLLCFAARGFQAMSL